MAGAYLFHPSQAGMCGHIPCQGADCSSADACLLILEATRAGAGALNV